MLIGIQQLSLLLGFLILDVILNDHWIEVLNKRPNHYLNWLIRFLFLSAIAYENSLITWMLHAINLGLLYWFLFDLALNLVRKLPFDYLGDAVIYRVTKKYVVEFPMFCFKAIYAIFAIALLVFDYVPY